VKLLLEEIKNMLSSSKPCVINNLDNEEPIEFNSGANPISGVHYDWLLFKMTALPFLGESVGGSLVSPLTPPFRRERGGREEKGKQYLEK